MTVMQSTTRVLVEKYKFTIRITAPRDVQHVRPSTRVLSERLNENTLRITTIHRSAPRQMVCMCGRNSRGVACT